MMQYIVMVIDYNSNDISCIFATNDYEHAVEILLKDKRRIAIDLGIIKDDYDETDADYDYFNVVNSNHNILIKGLYILIKDIMDYISAYKIY